MLKLFKMPLTQANVPYSDTRNAKVLVELFEISNKLSKHKNDENSKTMSVVIRTVVENLQQGKMTSMEAEEFCERANKVLSKPTVDTSKLFSTGGVVSVAKKYIESVVGESKDTNFIDMGKKLYSEYNKGNDLDVSIQKGLDLLNGFNKKT